AALRRIATRLAAPRRRRASALRIGPFAGAGLAFGQGPLQLLLGPDAAPLAHGPEGEHGHHGDAPRRRASADHRADAGRARAGPVALELHEAPADERPRRPR